MIWDQMFPHREHTAHTHDWWTTCNTLNLFKHGGYRGLNSVIAVDLYLLARSICNNTPLHWENQTDDEQKIFF